MEVIVVASYVLDMTTHIKPFDSLAAWENEGGSTEVRATAWHRKMTAIASWLVPPVVVPIALIVLVLVYAACRAYS